MAPTLKAILWAAPLAIVMSVTADCFCTLFGLDSYRPANGWAALFAGGLWYILYHRFQARE